MDEKTISANEAYTKIKGLVRLAKLCDLAVLAEDLASVELGVVLVGPHGENAARELLSYYEAAVKTAKKIAGLDGEARAEMCVEILGEAVEICASKAKPVEAPCSET